METHPYDPHLPGYDPSIPHGDATSTTLSLLTTTSSGFKSACKRDCTTLSALWPNTRVFSKALKGSTDAHTQRCGSVRLCFYRCTGCSTPKRKARTLFWLRPRQPRPLGCLTQHHGLVQHNALMSSTRKPQRQQSILKKPRRHQLPCNKTGCFPRTGAENRHKNRSR